MALATSGSMEMAPDRLGCFAINHRGQRLNRSLLYFAQAAEVCQQPLARACAYARNLQQLRIAVAHLAALAMVADSEAVALVADDLHHVQHGRAAVEHDGLVFVAVDVDHFFALGD